MIEPAQIHANSIFTKQNGRLVDLYVEAATAVGAMSTRRNFGERCGDVIVKENQVGVELTFDNDTQRATWYTKLEELVQLIKA